MPSSFRTHHKGVQAKQMDGASGRDEGEPVRESVMRRRRRWSDQEKAQIVREVQRPGAILQEAAQRHGLHPSLLTRWRAQHRTVVKKAPLRQARLLPVRVEPQIRVEPQTRSTPRASRVDDIRSRASKLGSIEVEFSTGRRVHIQGMVDAQTLRTLLQELSRS
jgi:transposase-like protein